ncbi:VanZ family protein [Streptomyces sp. DG1A-41]|uniref:VanZ family protein n=1 Tax=Streptomyces sp. DG1A-41 TaxID=3125779 RepID=UPI0030D28F42
MFITIPQNHYDYLAICTLTALVLGGATWFLFRRMGYSFGALRGGLAATLTGVLGANFMGSGRASRQCVISRDLVEPFHTTQGMWNLAMTVALGFFALLAVRHVLPALFAVVTLPVAIEFTQATVNGLGRTCDSADAEMNILGGIAGVALAAALLAARGGKFSWHGSAKPTLAAFAVTIFLGTGLARSMVTFTHVDSTSLATAGSQQRQAVEEAVNEAFGDHYVLGEVHEQPCAGVSCTNVVFNLLSRDKRHPDEFGNGSLSWPDKNHLNVLLVDSDRPSVMGYPVPEAEKPNTEESAFKIAKRYMIEHYPWAKNATTHKTYKVGEAAELGWMTSFRWFQGDVLMPRMLDVQVSRAGQVSQVDVALGPMKAELPKAKLDASRAESAVLDGLAVQYRATRGSDMSTDQLKAHYQLDAFTLKATKRDGLWHPEWLVNVAPREDEQATEPEAPGAAEMWRVDAVNGTVYDGTNEPVRIRLNRSGSDGGSIP